MAYAAVVCAAHRGQRVAGAVQVGASWGAAFVLCVGGQSAVDRCIGLFMLPLGKREGQVCEVLPSIDHSDCRNGALADFLYSLLPPVVFLSDVAVGRS